MQINDCSIRVSRSFAQCLGSKAAACKVIFNLPYASYCPTEKYMPLRVRNPGYPDLRALLCAGYMTHLKLTLISFGFKDLFVRNSCL